MEARETTRIVSPRKDTGTGEEREGTLMIGPRRSGAWTSQTQRLSHLAFLERTKDLID